MVAFHNHLLSIVSHFIIFTLTSPLHSFIPDSNLLIPLEPCTNIQIVTGVEVNIGNY